MKTRHPTGVAYNRFVRIALEGTAALVTGGANGIGLATVRLLKACGADVWLADLPGEQPEETARREGVRGVAVDVTDAASIESAMDAAGGPAIVVANAGVAAEGPLEDTSREAWDRVVGVNLTGAFLTVRSAARRMKRRRGGSIVLTASTNSYDGERWLTAYNAAKHGILGILHTAANELGPWGIRVNAVCPGYIRTRLTESGFADPSFMREYTRHLPLGRGGEAEEVARAIVFLASPLASFITGADLLIDGGQMAAKFGVWNEDIGAFKADHWELK